MNTNLLHNLNGSFAERKDTIDILKLIPAEIAHIERLLMPAINNGNVEADNAYHFLRMLRITGTLTIDKLQTQEIEDTTTLHEIYDIFESHRLVPHSKVID